MNLVTELLENASKSPRAAALSTGGRLWTYEELFEHVLSLAAGLAGNGLEPGQRVGVCAGNSPAFVTAYLAVAAAGGVAVPQNVLLRPREWAEQARDSGMRLQLCEERFARLVADEAKQLAVSLVPLGDPARPFAALRGRALRPPVERLATDAASMPYTAAYDGYYHGAVLTHGSLLANARASADAWDVTAGDRIAAFLPLFHSFGTTTAMLTPLLAGAEVVLLERFSTAEAGAVLRARRPTILPAVPTMFVQLLDDGLLGGETTASVRNFTAGGAALPAELYEKARDACGVVLLEGYGLTESSPVVSVNRDAATQKVGSVGLPLRGVELAVQREGRLAPPLTVGEVLVRGPSTMAGYHAAPELTARTLEQGWLHTRDLGYLDEDGYLFLTGRLLPMAITGGFNIYPAELERVLLGHEAVDSVQLEVLPDPVYGELLSAAVTLRPGAAAGAAELQSWCRRQLSAYKIPRRFDVREAAR
jgi:long-chain acyl-CoA synthetase